MKQDSTRQSAANRARIRRLRAQYNRRLVAAIIICFILGAVAGVFGYRWYAKHKPRLIKNPMDVKTVSPAPDVTPEPEAWAEEPGLFLEDDRDSEVDGAAIQDAFPEVENEPEGDDGPVIFPEDEPEAEATDEPAVNSDAVAEFDPAQAEVPEEYLTIEDENGEAEAAEAQPEAGEAVASEPETVEPEATEAETGEAEPAEVEAEPETTETEAVEVEPEAVEPEATEAETGEVEPVEVEAEPEATEAETGEAEPVEAEAEPETTEAETGEAEPEATDAEAGEPEAAETETEAESDAPEAQLVVPELSGEAQVIAIVPFGESFTYTTQIDANGNARVTADEGAYETLSFTQTMKNNMRPTDFADQYAKTYKLQGDEAGAGFELILNDYTGAATIIPQNIIDISLCSESGQDTERGYQLMDAPIDGNYGVALATNTPKMLYKRYPYSNLHDEMAYLVVTTYNDGVSQIVLFQMESDEPEAEPETVYAILQRGIVSDEVANMQARLIELGYLTGAADGSFGGMTEEAIKKAQEAFGMEANGIADAAFQQKLFEGAEPTPTPGAYAALRENSVGEAVVNLQLRLRELGYYDGRADGGYGPMTVAAVKRAQAAFGFEQTGIADGAFQEKLFEGAEPTPTPQPEETPNPEPTPNNVGGENTVG